MENGNNEGLKWDTAYSIGNDDVDVQHQQIFDLLSSLVKSCENGSDTAILKDTLDFLVNYTCKHFNDEESLQIKYNYPEYEKHKQMHEDFKLTVAGLVHQFTASGSSLELNKDIKRIVVKWLIHHIISEDKKIGVHIRQYTGGGS
ncbi:MAG: hemerythrin family protein [Treponema sp.]|nr:hemerythrin family protein [Treponema sp.]